MQIILGCEYSHSAIYLVDACAIEGRFRLINWRRERGGATLKWILIWGGGGEGGSRWEERKLTSFILC